jgi:hypothetical protein
MSYMTNRAVRAQLPPAEMVAFFGSYHPTCPRCQSRLDVHDIQIHLAEEPENTRFPKDADEPSLCYNRMDLALRCPACSEHVHLIVMPTAEDGALDYYYDVLSRREDTV